jgi:hypothetical protein
MLAAQMGIVFHTTYNGKSMESLRASFNIDVGNFTQTKDVWFRDASFVDASGTATFTDKETRELTDILSTAGKIFQSINPAILNRISTNETFNLYIKTFNNTKVRAGEHIKDTQQHTVQLVRWIEDRLNKEILVAKKEETRKKRIGEKNEVMRFFRGNAGQLKLIFDLMNDIVDAKVMIVRKLEIAFATPIQSYFGQATCASKSRPTTEAPSLKSGWHAIVKDFKEYAET